jgi:hypothetical protein
MNMCGHGDKNILAVARHLGFGMGEGDRGLLAQVAGRL